MAQFINEQLLVEKWGKIIEKTTDITNRDKKKWMSLLCETQKLYEDLNAQPHLNPNNNLIGMGAATFPGNPSYMADFRTQTHGSGDKAFSLLPLAMQVSARTIALDLLPVIPMASHLGQLTYFDGVYAGGNLKTKENPLLIQVKTVMASGEALVSGTTYYVRLNATNFYQFTFVGKSRVNGLSIFRAIPTNTDGSSRGIGAVADQSIEYVISNCSIYTSAAGATEIGDFSGYAELVRALEDHVASYVGRSMRLGDTTGEEGFLREEGETEYSNSMGLTMYSKSVDTKTYKVHGNVTQEQLEDMRSSGIDVMAQLQSLLANEMIQSLNKLILSQMFKMGATSHCKWALNTGENWNLNYNSTDQPIYLGLGVDNNPVSPLMTKKVTLVQGDTSGDLQRKVFSAILGAKGAINNHTLRGAGTFAVTNYRVATLIQNMAGFTAYPLTNTIAQTTDSLYNIGSIAGVNIYIDPNMNFSDTRVLVGRNGGADSTGLIFMPYLMAQSQQIINPQTMSPKVEVRSRFALVEAGHYPEDNYITFKVEAGDVLPNLI